MQIQVPLPASPYTIYLDAPGTLADLCRAQFPNRQLVCITNTTINRLHDSAITALEDATGCSRLVLDDGESFKTMDSVMTILTFLLQRRYERSTVLVALGGGVIGDMVGFAASLFLRGVDYIQVPTTLLAMVDSSVGGKTGVNHPMGKNLIGSFYQPRLVWIDTSFLSTLSDREFMAGYGEICKYAFIGGQEMFRFIATRHRLLATRTTSMITDAIERSIRIKAAVVAADEKESGNRALLNFGHTFGHSLEHFFHYSGILHGEAVLWGIRCAVDCALRSGICTASSADPVRALCDDLIVPPLPAPPVIDDLYAAMHSDKKVEAGTIRFVLPQSPGTSIISKEVTREQVMATLKAVFEP